MTFLVLFSQRNFKGFIEAFHEGVVDFYGEDYKEFEICFESPEFVSIKETFRKYHENVGKKAHQRAEIQKEKTELEHKLEQHMKKIPEHVFLKWLFNLEMCKAKHNYYMADVRVIASAIFSDLSIDAMEILVKYSKSTVNIMKCVSICAHQENRVCQQIGDDLLQKTKIKHLLKCINIDNELEYGFGDFCGELSRFNELDEKYCKFLIIFLEIFLENFGSRYINKVYNRRSVLEMTYYMPGDVSFQILTLLLKHDELSLINMETGNHILPYIYQTKNMCINFNTRSNFENFFEKLLDHKDLDINGTCNGSTVLMEAVQDYNCDGKKIKMLLNRGDVDAASINATGQTVLHDFLSNGIQNEDTVNELLPILLKKAGSRVNTVDNQGNTALHCSVKYDKLFMFNQIMCFHEETKLVDLNARDNEGCTPIMLAKCDAKSYNKDLPAVPESKEDWVRYCKEVNEAVGESILARLMQNENVEKNVKDKDGLPVLLKLSEHDICHGYDVSLLKLLFWLTSNQSEDFINAEDEKGMSLLSHVVQYLFRPLGPENLPLDYYPGTINAQHIAVKYLFQVLKFHPTFNVNSQDKEGKTALMHVITCGPISKSSLLKILLEYTDININLCDNQSCTLLMYAARAGVSECVELVSSHPDVNGNLMDNSGFTALHYALKETIPKTEQIKIIKILINNLDLDNVNCKGLHDLTAVHILLQHKEFSTIITLLRKMEKHATGLIDFTEKTSSRKDVWDSLLETLNECKEEPARNELQKILKLALSLPNAMVNKTYQDKRTILHKAALLGCSSAWNQFLEEPSLEVNLQDDFGNTALMYGVRKLPWQDIKSFLCKFPQINVSLQNNKGETLMEIIDGSVESDMIKKGLVEVAVATQKCLSSSPDALLHQVGLPTQFESLKKGIGLDKSIEKQRKDIAVKLLTQCEKELDANKDSSYGEFYSMPELERTKLQMLHTKLLSELEVNTIVSFLYEKQVITEDMLDEINCEKMRSKKCEKLLLILPHRGKKAYGYFLEALRHESVNQPHLAEMIEEFEPDKDFSLSSTSSDDDGALVVYQRQDDIPIPNFATDGKVVYVTNYITQNFHGKPQTE